MTTILIVPGLGGSGPEHWQTRWEELDPRCLRVPQRDWDAPECSLWVTALERAVRDAVGEVVLVAHSLGVVLVAHWARSGSVAKVKGALLVAPPDVESPERAPIETRSFAPIPRQALPFASMVVASRDDPYACIECAQQLAAAWGSRFVDLGVAGHINAASGLGAWQAGRDLLAQLL